MVKKNEKDLRDLSTIIRITSICTKGAQEGTENEKGSESSFKEIMRNIFQNLEKEMNIQIHDVQRTSSRLKSRQLQSETEAKAWKGELLR